MLAAKGLSPFCADTTVSGTVELTCPVLYFEDQNLNFCDRIVL
jgi:hypothetical protein